MSQPSSSWIRLFPELASKFLKPRNGTQPEDQSSKEKNNFLEGSTPLVSEYYRNWKPTITDQFYRGSSSVKAILTCGSCNANDAASVLVVHANGDITALSTKDWKDKTGRLYGQLSHHSCQEKIVVWHATFDSRNDDIYVTSYESSSGQSDVCYISRAELRLRTRRRSSAAKSQTKLLLPSSQTDGRTIGGIAFDSDRQLLFASCPFKKKDISCWLVESSDGGKTATLLFSLDCKQLGVGAPWNVAIFYDRTKTGNENVNSRQSRRSSQEKPSYFLAVQHESRAVEVEILTTTVARLTKFVQESQQRRCKSIDRMKKDLFTRSLQTLKVTPSCWAPVVYFDDFGNLIVSDDRRLKVYTFGKYTHGDGVSMNLKWESKELIDWNRFVIDVIAVTVNPKTQQPVALIAAKCMSWMAIVE